MAKCDHTSEVTCTWCRVSKDRAHPDTCNCRACEVQERSEYHQYSDSCDCWACAGTRMQVEAEVQVAIDATPRRIVLDSQATLKKKILLDGPAPSETTLTGGSSGYYKVDCVDDNGVKYQAECKHIINAKNLNFNMANVFKANFRMGDKQSTTVEYDLEKMIFFTVEELRRVGIYKDNDMAIEAFKRIIGSK